MKKTLAVLTLGLSLCAQAQTTIKIATLSPLSGGQSDAGLQIKNGAQLAVNEYKAQFKKLGFDLTLLPLDDQADPATGTAAARKAAADKQVLALVGTLNSGVALPASAAVVGSHLAWVSPANTANEITDRGLKNVSRIVARVDAQGPAGAAFVQDKLKAKKVYVLNDKTAYGEVLSRAVEKDLRRRGVQIVASEGTEEKSDFSPIIQKIQLMKPDAVYFSGMYNQVGVFAKQLRERGINIPIVGGDGYDSNDLLSIAGSGAHDIYFTATAAPADVLPAAKQLDALYQKTFHRSIQGFGIFGYDATKVTLQALLGAIQANGNKLPSREQVESAVRKVKATGLISGDVQFNSAGDRTESKLYIRRANGKGFTLEGVQTIKAKP